MQSSRNGVHTSVKHNKRDAMIIIIIIDISGRRGDSTIVAQR